MATATERRTSLQTEAKDIARIEGKYLIFFLNNEEYGFEILRVREIIGNLDITFVPQTPRYVKGVINLRGKVIPVVDLRLKFGMEEVDYTNATCIIVVEALDHLIGVVVDAVSEVVFIHADDVEPTPAFGAHAETSFILGMGKSTEGVKILLDIEQALEGDEKVLRTLGEE